MKKRNLYRLLAEKIETAEGWAGAARLADVAKILAEARDALREKQVELRREAPFKAKARSDSSGELRQP